LRPLPWVLFLIAGPLFAQSIDTVCPGATAVLSSATFPVDAAHEISTGTVQVDFVIRADGSVVDVAIHSSTHRALESSALETLAKVRCTPQPSDIRVRLPMDFRKPLAAGLVCPNYDSVMGSIEYPNEARHRRINSGNVTIDFV
jgi:TonB family protein